MRFSVSKVAFVDAINTVMSATSSRENDAYGAIQIEAHEIDQLVHIRAVSYEMAMATRVAAVVESDGITMVPARVLSSVARVTQGTEVDCELIGQELHFGGSKSTMMCRILSDATFPYPKIAPPVEFAIIDSALFKKGVQMASTCAVKGTILMAYAGLRVQSKDGEVTLVGCNGGRAVRMVVGESDIPFEGILPQKAAAVALKLASRGENITLSGDDNRIGFRAGDFVLHAVQLAGAYPEVERILPKEPTTTAKVSLPELLGMVARVKAVAKSGAADLVKINLTTEEEAVTIVCNGPLGSVRESISATVEGPLVVDVQYAWNFFADMAAFLDSEIDTVIGFVGDRANALLVQQGAWMYMAMPIVQRQH